MAAYVPTVWVNDKAPALSAANLNKLTNELEVQAATVGVLHTLPNWTDGATPALTEAAPWNEMERVLAAIASAKGLSYTATVWSGGWEPTRNAYRLNRMESQAVLNRAAIDQAPGTFVSKSAYYNIAGGSASLLWPTARLDDYKFFVGPSGGAQDTASRVGLVYVNPYANTAHGLMGMTYTEANTNGWILSDASGQLSRVGYPNAFLTLAGSSAFCLKWCQNVLALYPNADGFMCDDINAYIPAVTENNRVPTAYPTEASSIAAVVYFCTYVHDFFTVQRGKPVFWNAGNFKPGDGASDTGARTVALYQQTPGNFTSESWLVIGNSYVRLAGTGWDQNWDGWRTLHQTCVTQGVHFLPFHEGAGRSYGMCSFLLDWDGVHGAFAYSANRTTDFNPWTTFEDQAKTLGLPTGDATKTGNVWRRNFAGGYVLVDPTLGTSSITLT